MSALLPLFQWLAGTWVAEMMRHSKASIWLFPAIESVHIVALTLLLGTILILNLRLCELTLRARPVSRLARELAPWTLCSLIIMLATGPVLVASDTMKYYASPSFQVKMIFLATALVFHYTIFRRMTRANDANIRPGLARLVAVVSLILWFGVGWAGRAIGVLG